MTRTCVAAVIGVLAVACAAARPGTESVTVTTTPSAAGERSGVG